MSVRGEKRHNMHVQQDEKRERVQTFVKKVLSISRRRCSAVTNAVREHVRRHRARVGRDTIQADEKSKVGMRRRHQRHDKLLRQILCDLLTGALAEGACVAALYPIDTIKVRIQSAGKRAFDSSRIVRSLYRGVIPCTAAAMVFGSVYILVYERCRDWLETRHNPPRMLIPAIACVFANVSTSFIEVPLDTAKQKLQAMSAMSKRSSRSQRYIPTLIKLYNGGIGSLYNTYLAYTLRTIPFEVAEFTVYEGLRKMLRSMNSSHEQCINLDGGPVLWVLGGLAGCFATIITMPVDNIKTRMNVYGSGFMQSFVFIARAHGARGFFRGTGARLATHVPSAAVYFYVYQHSKRLLRQKVVAGIDD